MKKNKSLPLILTIFTVLFFSCTDQSRVKGGSDPSAKYSTLLTSEGSENSAKRETTGESAAENAGDGVTEEVTQTEIETDNEAKNEESIDYSRYGVMSFYSEETVDDLYDAISYVVYIDDQRGHPMLIKDGDKYHEVTGVGFSPTQFMFNGDTYTDRFYAQTVDGVFFIGVAIRDNTTYQYSLCAKDIYGTSFVDVFELYRFN